MVNLVLGDLVYSEAGSPPKSQPMRIFGLQWSWSVVTTLNILISEYELNIEVGKLVKVILNFSLL